MSEKQTLATKGLYFPGPPAFCDDGEDAMYLTFPDGHTVKYVPERTCRIVWNEMDETWECDACGASVCHESVSYCEDCGAKVVAE